MEIAMLVLTAIGVAAAIIAALPPLGFDVRIFGRPNMPLEGIPYFRARQAWIAIVVALISLGVSVGAFYYFFRPRTVERVVEKQVEKLVPAPCPKQQALGVKPILGGKSPKKNKHADASAPRQAQQPPQTQFCEGGNCAQSTGQSGGITAGLVLVDTPPLAIKWAAQNAVSDKPAEFPYAQQVTVSVNTLLSPVSLAIICDSEVDEFSLYGAHANVFKGISEKHIAFFKYSSPVLSPEDPLVIQVRAKKPFFVKDVRRAKLP